MSIKIVESSGKFVHMWVASEGYVRVDTDFGPREAILTISMEKTGDPYHRVYVEVLYRGYKNCWSHAYRATFKKSPGSSFYQWLFTKCSWSAFKSACDDNISLEDAKVLGTIWEPLVTSAYEAVRLK